MPNQTSWGDVERVASRRFDAFEKEITQRAYNCGSLTRGLE